MLPAADTPTQSGGRVLLSDRLLGERLAERGLEVIPTGPPPTPPTQPTPPVLTTPPTLATPPTSSSIHSTCSTAATPSTPVDMTLIPSSKTISPRPSSRLLNQIVDEMRSSSLTPEQAATRQPYSPVSRPSSTEATTPTTVEGSILPAGYSRSKSPRNSSRQPSPQQHGASPSDGVLEKPHMPPPVPSPGRDGLEARLAQLHHKSLRGINSATPPSSSNINNCSNSSPVMTLTSTTSVSPQSMPHHLNHQLHPSIQHITSQHGSIATNTSQSASASAITNAIAAAATKYGSRSSTASPSSLLHHHQYQQQQARQASHVASTATSSASPPVSHGKQQSSLHNNNNNNSSCNYNFNIKVATTNNNNVTSRPSSGVVSSTCSVATTIDGAICVSAKPSTTVPVEGLAAALHARYLQQQKQNQVPNLTISQ